MPRVDASRRRCAIYTRKSSEEGLEQEFNSLAAQREACEAFIRSQRNEGWVLVKTRYDDGGFSGGNLERPALQHLIADTRAGRIDIVVVYKVDRLTRSLADFARLVELFDAEAESVRRIFALYREHGCVRRVKEEADRLGLRTKCSTTTNGTERGGKPFSRGHLYALLANPIYTGHIAHKGELHPGQQAALIDDESWSAVRDQLATNTSDHRRRVKAAEPSPLTGLLVDAQGERLTPSHAVKKGRRYRYYVSAALITDAGTDRAQGWRLAAREIEEAVIRILADALTSPARLVEQFGSAGMPSDQVRKLLSRAARMAAALDGSPGERAKLVRELVEKIVVDEKTIIIK